MSTTELSAAINKVLSDETDVGRASGPHQAEFPYGQGSEAQVTRREFCNFLFLTSTALLAGAGAPAIGKNLIPDARMLLAVLADNRDVGNMDWGFLLDDTAFDIPLWVGTRVPLDHLDAFNHDLLVSRHHDQDPACLATVFATKNEHLVIFFDWRHG